MNKNYIAAIFLGIILLYITVASIPFFNSLNTEIPIKNNQTIDNEIEDKDEADDFEENTPNIKTMKVYSHPDYIFKVSYPSNFNLVEEKDEFIYITNSVNTTQIGFSFIEDNLEDFSGNGPLIGSTSNIEVINIQTKRTPLYAFYHKDKKEMHSFVAFELTEENGNYYASAIKYTGTFTLRIDLNPRVTEENAIIPMTKEQFEGLIPVLESIDM